MKNFLQEGEVLSVIAPQNVLSGDVVVVGSLAGIATTDALSGAAVSLATEGVFAITKTAGATFNPGDKVGWNHTTSAAVVAGTAATPLIGVAVLSSAGGDGTVKTIINFPFVQTTAT